MKARYSTPVIKQMAVFDCKLPDFCSSKKLTVEAYIDEDAIGKHDIIFGRSFCAELGIIMNYKTKPIIWDNLFIPMSTKNRVPSVNNILEDPGDKDLPPFMQRSTQRMSKGLNPNAYDKQNFRDMVD